MLSGWISNLGSIENAVCLICLLHENAAVNDFADQSYPRVQCVGYTF